jgi:hypothetical protein
LDQTGRHPGAETAAAIAASGGASRKRRRGEKAHPQPARPDRSPPVAPPAQPIDSGAAM